MKYFKRWGATYERIGEIVVFTWRSWKYERVGNLRRFTFDPN